MKFLSHTLTTPCPECREPTIKQTTEYNTDGGFDITVLHCDCGWVRELERIQTTSSRLLR